MTLIELTVKLEALSSRMLSDTEFKPTARDATIVECARIAIVALIENTTAGCAFPQPQTLPRILIDSAALAAEVNDRKSHA